MSAPRRRFARADGLALGYAVGTGALAATLGPSLLTLGLPTLGLLGLITDGVARPASGVLVPTVWHGPRTGDRVALTFDDGPHREFTPPILDLLDRHGAKATFFGIGRHIDAHPQIAARIVADHELGNHSYDHARTLNFRGVTHMEQQISLGEAAAHRAGFPVDGTPLYRPPVGLKNPALSTIAARRGLRVVTWSVHSRDTRLSSPRTIADRVLKRARPGDIILLHDGSDRPDVSRAHTVDATALILAGLAARGLRSTTVSELLTG